MLTVLVVDDDQASRHTIRALLESTGYFVREAVSLAGALDVLRGASIDLILSDEQLGGESEQVWRGCKSIVPLRRRQTCNLASQVRVYFETKLFHANQKRVR
jgi:CheY-like chemotaxis protein